MKKLLVLLTFGPFLLCVIFAALAPYFVPEWAFEFFGYKNDTLQMILSFCLFFPQIALIYLLSFKYMYWADDIMMGRK